MYVYALKWDIVMNKLNEQERLFVCALAVQTNLKRVHVSVVLVEMVVAAISTSKRRNELILIDKVEASTLQTYTHIHTHTHTHTHTHVKFRSQAVASTHTHIHNYTHTHSLSLFPLSPLSPLLSSLSLSLFPSLSLSMFVLVRLNVNFI